MELWGSCVGPVEGLEDHASLKEQLCAKYNHTHGQEATSGLSHADPHSHLVHTQRGERTAAYRVDQIFPTLHKHLHLYI